MSLDLLRPATQLQPSEAIHVSQQAQHVLRTSWALPFPLDFLLASDAPEKWTVYENLFYSCLRTGDERSAALCLKRLRDRFGVTNARIMGLMGVYHEAIAKTPEELKNYLDQYTEAIDGDWPENTVIHKRRVALLRSMGKLPEATDKLVDMLKITPVDAEGWAELADLYFVQGQFSQAVFALEEVLIITPNAWNVYARLAEVLYISASGLKPNDIQGVSAVVRSMKTFCRSVELCDDYLRGFYGLKLSTNKLIRLVSGSDADKIAKELAGDDFGLPSLSLLQKLNQLATAKLAEIIRRSSSGENGWTGYAEAELIAARELLDRDVNSAPK